MILMKFRKSESSGKETESSNKKVLQTEKATRLRKMMLKDFFNLFLFLFISSVGIFVLVTYLVLLPHLRSLERTIRKVTTLLESSVNDLNEFVTNAERDITTQISEQVATLKNSVDNAISEFLASQWLTGYDLSQPGASNFLPPPYKIEKMERVEQIEPATSAQATPAEATENPVSFRITNIGEDLYLVGKLSKPLTQDGDIAIMLNESERVRRHLVPNLIDMELSFKQDVENLLAELAKAGAVIENAKADQKEGVQTEFGADGQLLTWDASLTGLESKATISLSFLARTYTLEIPSLRSEVSEKIRKLQEELKNTTSVTRSVSKFVAELQDFENVKDVRYTIEHVGQQHLNEATEVETNAEATESTVQIDRSVDKGRRAFAFTLVVRTREEAHLITFLEVSDLLTKLDDFASRLSKTLGELLKTTFQVVGNVQSVRVLPVHLAEELLASRGLKRTSLQLVNVVQTKEGSQAELVLKFLDSIIVVQYDPAAELTSKIVAKLKDRDAGRVPVEGLGDQNGGGVTETSSIFETIADLYPVNRVQHFGVEKLEKTSSGDRTSFSNFSIKLSEDGSILAGIKIGSFIYSYQYNPAFSVVLALDNLLRTLQRGDVASVVLEVNKLLSSKNVADLEIREVQPKEVPIYLRSSLAGDYDYFVRSKSGPEIMYEVHLRVKDRYVYFAFSESKRIEKICANVTKGVNKHYGSLMWHLRDYLRNRLGVSQMTQKTETLGEKSTAPEVSHEVEVKRGEKVNVRVTVNLFGERTVFSATRNSLDFLKNELKSIFEDLGTVESIYVFSERALKEEREPKPILAMKTSQQKSNEVALSMIRRSMKEQRPIVEMLNFAGTALPRFVSVALPIRMRDVTNLFLYAQYETNVMVFMFAGAGLLFVNILAMLILLFLTKRHAESISRPFEVLTQSMEEFAESKLFDPEKLPKSNVLEVQKLVRYYASLAEELAASIEELRAANEELEDSYKVIEELSKEIEDSYVKFAEQLAVIAESYDESTGNHIERVGELSYFIARELGLDQGTAEKIRKFAPLHDIGKILIPKEILDKPGKLTDEEFELMKKHTIYGEKLIGGKEYFRIARNIALYHHEKYDGSGYPHGLKGEEIPIEAQIVAVVDVYDALRSERPYKKAFSHEEAISIIVNGDNRTRPTHFAPSVLDIFKRYSDEIGKIWDEVSRRTMLRKVNE